jgi:hypothetical protein
MPTPDDPALRSLRLGYNAGKSAYQDCGGARAKATVSGAALSPAQLDKEIATARILNEIRDQLLAAMSPTQR